MLTPAALWQRVHARDPEYDAMRRAVRAGLMLPVVAAAGFSFGGVQTPLFAILGAVALLILADFPGNRPARALAYAGLGVNGAILITLGTVVAPVPWLAVTVMFVVAVAVMFAGVLSEIVAAGQRSTLLTFVPALCLPPGPIPDRLLGWVIALALCVPAALFLFPPRHHNELRLYAARVCATLADRLDRDASADDVTEAMDKLRTIFLGADFRPVGLTAGSRALVRVIDDLQWLSDLVKGSSGVLLAELREPIVAVLRESAAVLETGGPERETHRAALAHALAMQRLIAQSRYREDILEILGEPDDAAAVLIGRKLLTRRTISACVSATGRVIGLAADADARPVWARVLGRRLPDSGAAARVLSESEAIAVIPSGFVATRAVVVRNSVRTGLGLALAVGVTHLFPLQNGLWVVLGAMSVLRSSALTTGTRVVRAVTGTVIGFGLGAAFIALMGVDPLVMWLTLPVVAFGSAFVPEVASFIAGQAAFTMMVVIIFNLIHPIGWRVGLIRVEDVIIGALVGVVVSLLLWPRGAAPAVARSLDAARQAGVAYMRAAVLRVTRGASEEADDRISTLGFAALSAGRTVDDTVRHYLSESGGLTDQRAPVIRSANRATRLRGAAELIADVVPPPLQAYPDVRTVLESHCDALCERFRGVESVTFGAPISDDFVRALRAGAGDGELAVSAALPLVAVAANLGELELLYPEPAARPVTRP
ncbi:FUSC family protein [Mycobacterium sp. BMJ-28]